MKTKVTLEIEIPDIGATEKQVKDYIKYVFFYKCYLSIDNYKVTDIEIKLL